MAARLGLVVDMKAGLVAALHTAETLEKFGISENSAICMAFNSDEEIGPLASPGLSVWHSGVNGFVLEPCRATGDYVLQRKGVGYFTSLPVAARLMLE